MWSQMSLLILLTGTLKAFTVLPYVQIDFVHYFRLAQCEAKCAEKYGKLLKRRLNDGTFIEYYSNDGDHYKLCAVGCSRRRTVLKPERINNQSALTIGMQFWIDTNAYAGSGQPENLSIESVRVGCMDGKRPSVDQQTDLDDTISVWVFVYTRQSVRIPLRYIVQWKQRTFGDKKLAEENGWITAAIENEPEFEVHGLLPGAQYRFMVTGIGPNGRLGGAVMSDWIRTPSHNDDGQQSTGPLLVSPRYDSDHGVSVLLSWLRRPQQRQHSASRRRVADERLLTLDTCHYTIAINNETFSDQITVQVDHSDSFLLTHLQFGTEYTLRLTSGTSTMVSQSVGNNESRILERKFMTQSCNEIFGPGSLQCAPEPVQRFTARIHENGTIEVHWIPSSEPGSVLVYQLTYQPVGDSLECSGDPTSTYINAASTSTSIELVDQRPCDYSLRLVNYDLIGRDAYSEITIRPPRQSLGLNLAGHGVPLVIGSMVLVAVCLLFLCCCCICRRDGRKKSAISTDHRDVIVIL